MEPRIINVLSKLNKPILIKKWKVRKGMSVALRQMLLLYQTVGESSEEVNKLKATDVGSVQKICAAEGAVVNPGDVLLLLEECSHPTVMRDMCAECGADLRQAEAGVTRASVPMVHSIPELKVSEEQAKVLGKADEIRLLSDRKLVLLVDLDQTLVHTTNDNIPPNLKDVVHFQLYGPQSPWYHTRIRPGTDRFLKAAGQLYELHICTFGARNYAHYIAMFLDPDGRFFSHRILSRDECFDANSKTANLKALFPCGDAMVCIIDDREDVWNYAPNLIHVKPYHFFQHTGDIHAPPGLAKTDNDSTDQGFDFSIIDDNEPKEGEKKPPKIKAAASGETTTDKDTEDETESKASKSTKPEPSSEEVKSDEVKEELLTEISKPTLQTDEKHLDKDTESPKLEVTSGLEIPEKGNEDLKTNDGCSNNCSDKIGVTDENDVANAKDLKLDDMEVDDGTMKKEAEHGTDDVDGKVKTKGSKGEFSTEGEEGVNLKKGKAEDLIEVEDMDDYLLHLEDILRKIHQEYYSEYDKHKQKGGKLPDLKTVIPHVKGQVLQGCELVFSGLVPSHVPLERSRAYLVAKSLGASIRVDLTPTTTHLVAARAGTAKVNASRRQKGVMVVTPDWLWLCAERWERVDERLYPLARGIVTSRHPPAHCSSPQQPQVEATPERFIDTINPLLTLTSEEVARMDQEVADLCADSEESDSDDPPHRSPVRTLPQTQPSEEEEESDDSLSGGQSPKGWTEDGPRRKRKFDTTTCTESDLEEDSPSAKFRRGEPLPSDLDLGDFETDTQDDSHDDSQDDAAWTLAGAALEREFLSSDK